MVLQSQDGGGSKDDSAISMDAVELLEEMGAATDSFAVFNNILYVDIKSRPPNEHPRNGLHAEDARVSSSLTGQTFRGWERLVTNARFSWHNECNQCHVTL